MTTKLCACPGCQKYAGVGSMFCAAHTTVESRMRFIVGNPPITNEQLSYMMRRDGLEQ